jgi:hypothetical protein
MRAQRPELLESSSIHLSHDLTVLKSWRYEKGDRGIGSLDLIEDRGNHYVIDTDLRQQSDADLRGIVWNVRYFLDKKNLVDRDHEICVKTLSELLISLSHKYEKTIMLLVPVLTERELFLKRHRHYAYALQWGLLAAVSLKYLLQTNKNRF